MDDSLSPGLGTSGNDEFAQCAASVETALELGYRHIDTAQMYDNEAAVGEGVANADVDREDVFVATKIHPDNLAPEDVRSTFAESLDRLGTDYADLLYVHWPMGAYDAEATLPVFDDLYEDGRVENVGVSNFSPDLLAEAVELLDAPVLANQFECHPFLQQEAWRAACEEHGVTPVAYCPIAQGEVVGHPVLESVADDHDATAAQVSLAWLDAKGVVPIPKATGDPHLRENWHARDLDLADGEVARIDDIEREERLIDPDAAPWNR
ncbi:aldo/keto reductase [Salarchaeum japonicum]|uniref:Aldo/keto reductase n=1 Tax=Salarchaeum japonicum TaxID=555573 RepID=A0AAV3T2W8_9EURY|nr:aldo/keto reductase [Salarchaeum japonicum]